MADKTYSPATVNENDSSQVKNVKKSYNDLLLKPNRTKKEESDLKYYSNLLGTQQNVAQGSAAVQRPLASNRDVSIASKDPIVQSVVAQGNKIDALKSERKSEDPETLAKQKQAIKDAEKEMENVTHIATEDLKNFPLEEDKKNSMESNQDPPLVETKTEEPRKLSYSNLYSYYKSGGFGDPTSSGAKRDFGFAILDTLGSGIANAGRGIKGQASEKGKWENVLAQGKQQEFTLEQMREMLKNNKELQAQSNELRKDFESWVTENGVKWGSDKEKMKAFKEYMAARGNSIVAGGTLDTALKGAQIASSVALPLILGLTGVSDERCKTAINLTK